MSEKRPLSANLALLLILVGALIWLVFAFLLAFGLLPGIPPINTIRWVLAILSYLCFGALAILLVMLIKRIRLAYYLVNVLLILITAMALTDDLGIIDLAFIILTVMTLVLLIVSRRWFLNLS